MEKENKLQDIIRTSLESIRSLVDANTIIGTPYVTETGVTIIPVSKISVGFATGGLDYSGKNEAVAMSKLQNFGGAGGTGLSISPVGFIVITSTGNVEFINVGMKTPNDPIEQIADIIERSPEIIEKIKATFAGGASKKSDAEEATEE